jgi:hypothetical protein
MKKKPSYIAAILVLSITVFFLSACEPTSRKSFPEVELRYEDNISLTYSEAIDAYRALDNKHKQARLITYGPTDFGESLQLFVISASNDFDPVSLRRKGYRIVMVNNGIHPGEPCGIDASVKLARDILAKDSELWPLLDSTVLCIIPVYNIGGAHNRSAFNRANQNGPAEQGFRANAKNLDLNRDYAPMDSRNAQSFAEIFHTWKPNLLIDTHTTNGADYQYVMTLIPNHPQELPPMLSKFYSEVMEPFIYDEMKNSDYEMTPYVAPIGRTPESGLQQYYNTPRYTTGYGRMFNTITFMTEAHMFKPFRDRVLATYSFIRACLLFTNQEGDKLHMLKTAADNYVANQEEFVLRWELDTMQRSSITFKGYDSEWVDSEFTGAKRLRYDRSKPFTKEVPYFKQYKPTLTVEAPDYYILPQAWHEVAYRLELNHVKLFPLQGDTSILVDAYYIDDYKTRMRPYNGHFLHYDISLRTESQKLQFRKGDFIIPMNQTTNQYIIEMLEPQAEDAFFVWNFFDPILQRREYFSPYVFEDYAFEMLQNDASLKRAFEEKKESEKEFANNSYAQLQYLYERSPFFEKTYKRYPVFRVNKR